jgi:hypothetical protein
MTISEATLDGFVRSFKKLFEATWHRDERFSKGRLSDVVPRPILVGVGYIETKIFFAWSLFMAS